MNSMFFIVRIGHHWNTPNETDNWIDSMKRVYVMAIYLSSIVAGFMPYAEAKETAFAPDKAEINLAVVAEVSSSYVAGDTALSALNNDIQPQSSNDNTGGFYGIWWHKAETQWVQYQWSQPISTCKIDVYWCTQHQGFRLPKVYRLLYWDGFDFVPVKNPFGLTVLENQYNTTIFDEVKTTKLRLEIDSDIRYPIGILEWKVYDSGQSPPFAPCVQAGVDRIVIQGGKTYLRGTVNELGGKKIPVKWNKLSGPGDVIFADASSPVTTAVFSEIGDYILSLKAGTEPLVASSTLRVKVSPHPPANSLEPVDIKCYAINSSFWNNRIKTLIVNWIPHCIQKFSNSQEGLLVNFVEAAKKLAGQEYVRQRGHTFSDAMVYHTILSICAALRVDPQGDPEIIAAQKEMQSILEDWIPKILAAQEPDGYLQTHFTLWDLERWSPQNRHAYEGGNAGLFLECAVSHYLLTDKTDDRLYRAAKKLADCWYNTIGPAPKKEWYDGHQGIEYGLVQLGRFVSETEGQGKGDKYIHLANFLLDCRGDGVEFDQSHIPVTQQYEAVGHAVRALICYTGMACVAKETGNIDYHSAILSAWDNIVNRKYYVTGGVGSGETSEGFGPNFSLPQNGYCEPCASRNLIYFQHSLNMIYGNAQYADLYEETLYNTLLGSIDLEGRNYYYQNPLDSQGRRYPWHSCPCCVNSISHTLLMLPTWMYVKSADSIYVNFFIGSDILVRGIAGTDVRMVQTTEYPWDGKVRITVNPNIEKSFSVRIRVPNRSVSELYTSTPDSDGIVFISINDEPMKPSIQSGYAILNRTWKAGDRIDLILPMEIQRVRGIKHIQATRGRVALRYGPLIYCTESIDQSLDKTLAHDAVLMTEWESDLLGGIMAIKGKWNDDSELLAIPYYARDNRFPTEATKLSDHADLTDLAGHNFFTISKGRVPASSVWLKEQ